MMKLSYLYFTHNDLNWMFQNHELIKSKNCLLQIIQQIENFIEIKIAITLLNNFRSIFNKILTFSFSVNIAIKKSPFIVYL